MNTLCEYLYIYITNFDAVSASYINRQSSCQETMANITHEAIANHSVDYGIADGEFTVDFKNASGDLLMVFSLCTSSGRIVLVALSTVLENEEESIEESIRDWIADEFGTDRDSMTVSISQEFQFSLHPQEKLVF